MKPSVTLLANVYTHTHIKMPVSMLHAERKEEAEPMEDEGTILRKMRRLTDYYDNHKEIGRWVRERRRTHTLPPPRIPSRERIGANGSLSGEGRGRGRAGRRHLLNNSRQKNERWVTRLSGANALARQMIRLSLTRRRRTFAVNCRAIWTAWLAGRIVCFPTSGRVLVIKQRSKLYSPKQHKQTPEKHEGWFSNLCTSSEFQLFFFLFSLVLNFSLNNILDVNGMKTSAELRGPLAGFEPPAAVIYRMLKSKRVDI